MKILLILLAFIYSLPSYSACIRIDDIDYGVGKDLKKFRVHPDRKAVYEKVMKKTFDDLFWYQAGELEEGREVVMFIGIKDGCMNHYLLIPFSTAYVATTPDKKVAPQPNKPRYDF